MSLEYHDNDIRLGPIPLQVRALLALKPNHTDKVPRVIYQTCVRLCQQYAPKDLERRFKKACKSGDLLTIKLCVFAGVDIHYALCWAAEKGHLEAFKFLVSKGANIHAVCESALICAAGEGHLKVVKFLVSQGANIHAVGESALRYAAINGHLEVVKFLASKGADIHVDGDDALYWAAVNGRFKVVDYLESLGCTLNV